MQAALLFLTGFVGGFCSSAPLGVINLWVTDATLGGRERTLKAFLAGVILMDVLYATLAFWGYHTFLQDGFSGALLGIVGGLFLVALGVLNMRAKLPQKVEDVSARTGKNPLKDLGLGIFMVASNPAFLMFWVFAVKLAEDRLGHVIQISGEVAFLAGIVVGDLTWFLLLVTLVKRGRSKFQPAVVTRLRFGIACAFILFGAWAVVRSANALTAWAPLKDYPAVRYF